MRVQMKFLAALIASCAAVPAIAQDYPTKPIRIVSAFPAGSPVDVLARLAIPKLTASFGQPVIVENRGGAGGNIGAQVVAKAPPDGYSVLATSSAITVNVTLYKAPGYAAADFIPLLVSGTTPNLVYVHPSVPAKNLRELFALAKNRTLSYASAGTGTGTQLFMEMLKRETGADITHVPFTPAAAITAVIANQVPIGITSMPLVLPHVKSGKLVALAATPGKRIPVLPGVPTVAESGFPGFEDSTWFAYFLRSGTPPGIVSRLHAEMTQAMEQPDVKDKLAGLNIEFTRQSQAEFAQMVTREIEKYRKVIRETGATAD
ncbi:MAG: tripartite tricarboxylate transporter substrate binding protein [Burkholderiales bacterium]|nr:tripartite tricarboxylate transporter substrate binding protein [Burkholderiales bacterium]